MKKKIRKRPERIFASGEDANKFYQRKAGAHDHKLMKRRKTRQKKQRIGEHLREF